MTFKHFKPDNSNNDAVVTENAESRLQAVTTMTAFIIIMAVPYPFMAVSAMIRQSLLAKVKIQLILDIQ